MKAFSKSLILLITSAIIVVSSTSVNAQKWKIWKDDEQNPSGNNFEAEKYFIEAEKYFILEDFNKAQVLFLKALEIEPENPAIHFKMAETLAKSGEMDKAITYGKKAIELNPKNKYYYLLTAEIYTRNSDFQQATNVYQSMVNNVSGTEEYLPELATMYAVQKNYDKALETFDQAEQYFGISEQISYQKQKIYLQQNQLDQAIAEAKRLIEAYPSQSDFVISMAEIMTSNNREDEAIPYLEEVLAYEPENAKALVMLARVYDKQGKKEQSRENIIRVFGSLDLELEKKVQVLLDQMKKLPDSETEKFAIQLADILIDTHPEEGIAFMIYGDLMNQLDERETSKNYYLKAIELGHENFAVWQNVLQMELMLEQYDQVVEHADRALELFPNQAAIYYFSGTAHLIKKQFQEAAFAFEQGKKLASGNTQLLSIMNGQLGDAYHSLEEYGKSDAAYEAALDANPENDHVLNNYSYYLSLRKDKLDLAKKMSTKLIKLNPDNANYLDTHAWVLFMLEEYDQARKVIEKALKGDPSGTIIEHYGDILYKLGDVDGAVKQWQRAKGMDESSELIDKKIADRKLYE
ncbi:MAG: tetratricopeptide repeat protein [Candidatus Cyclobacteriaceae bacterium M3_2C_046]